MSKQFELRRGQKEAISLVDQGKNVLCVFPTGYGKTIVGKQGVKKSKEEKKLSFVVTPLRALANQMFTELTSEGIKSILDIGDQKVEEIKDYNNYDCVITTYERLDSVLRKEKTRSQIKKEIGYVVIDEIHNLGSKNRSQEVFSLIQKLNIFCSCSFIGLSATIDNISYVAKMIHAEVVYIPPEERPIPLQKEFIVHGSGKRQEEIQIKIPIVLDLLNKNEGQCLVLCGARSVAEKLAKIFTETYKIPSDFHHSNMNPEKRVEKEKKYKSGKVRVLFCTTTLSQGLNLPGDFVIVFDYKFWNTLLNEYEFMERMLIDQFVGRAGRPGISKCNIAMAYILVNDKDESNLKSICSEKMIVELKLDPISLINEWVSSGLYDNIVDLISDLENFGVKSTGFVEAFRFLQGNGFISKNGNNLSPNYYGNLACWFFVHPRVILAIREMQDCSDEMSMFAQLCQGVPDIYNSVKCDEKLDSIILEKTSKMEFDDVVKKIIYYSFYNSFEKEPDENVSFNGKSLSGNINRFLVVAGMIIKNKEISKKIKNIQKELVLHRIMSEDELGLANLEGIGEKRLGFLYDGNIRTLSAFLKEKNEVLSKILGLKTETILKMKGE